MADNICKDFSRSPVPSTQTRTMIKILMVFAAFTINTATLIVAADIGIKASYSIAFGGVIIGGIILAAIGASMSIIGARTRLSTAMLANSAFGSIGGKAPSIIFALTLLGWFGVQTEVFAASLSEILRSLIGLEISRTIAIILSGVVMSSTAVIGYNALEKLSFLSVPLLLLLLLWPLAIYLSDNSLVNIIGHTVENSYSISQVISIVVGGFIVGAVIMPDIMRYAVNTKVALKATVVGFAVIQPLFYMLAILIALLAGKSDITAIMMALGLGVPALIVIIFASWTTNDSNLYSSSLGFANVFNNIPKYQLAAIAGVLGTILALMGILSYIIPWIIMLGMTIAPIGGAMVGSYLAKPSEYMFDNMKNAPQFRTMTIMSVLLGIALSFITSPVSNNGFGLFQLTTISALDGFALSAICAFIFNRRSVGLLAKLPEAHTK